MRKLFSKGTPKGWPEGRRTWREGVWYVHSGELCRFKPSIELLCGILWDAPPPGKPENAGLPLERRVKIFTDGLDCVKIFGDTRDLFALASFRRQVTATGNCLCIDLPFLKYAEKANLHCGQWADLARRMPTQTFAWRYCTKRAENLKPPVLLPYVAMLVVMNMRRKSAAF